MSVLEARIKFRFMLSSLMAVMKLHFNKPNHWEHLTKHSWDLFDLWITFTGTDTDSVWWKWLHTNGQASS